MSRSHHLRIEEHGDHVHVYGLPRHLEAVVGHALMVPLEKADRSEDVDPGWPDFLQVLNGAMVPWETWNAWLLRELARTPMARGRNPGLADQIRQRLREHETGVIAATTGATVDAQIASALVRTGQLRPDYPTRALVPQAVALGLGADPDQRRPPGTRTPPREPRTPAELGALTYARARAGAYMRRPVDGFQRAVTTALLEEGVDVDPRALSPDERAIIGREVAAAVRDRIDPAELAQRLRDATAGTTLTNDMERVARTELAFALNHGALAALRAKLRPGEDPDVYRIASPQACTECRRIWGSSREPVLYKLSYIEYRERNGGNFGLPAAAWGPVIGPVHPNCLCSPPIRHTAVTQELSNLIADRVRRGY
jgi:hypothetical protein